MIRSNRTEPSINRKQTLLFKCLSSLAQEQESYGILDYPDHSNVGDSAIFLGELELLRAVHGTDPLYTSSIKSNAADISRILPEGPIYLHGGGNFGDLWPAHQSFREHILHRYLDRKIIQLPQSIYFDDSRSLDRCAMAIDKHPDFTMLVRDAKSYSTAKAKFNCRVLMCPDAAYALGGLERTRPVAQPLLCLLRTDKESNLTPKQKNMIEAYGPIEDWVNDLPNIKSKHDHLIEKACVKVGFGRTFLQPTLSRIYETWARNRVCRGVDQLSKAQLIVTDRLHVHILSALLNIPHIVYDNSYGKISQYIDAWPKDRQTASFGNIYDCLSAARDRIRK